MFTVIIGFFAKYAILNKIKSAASFVLTHWRVFLVLAVLAYAAYQFNSLRNERDAAKQALKTMVDAIAESSAKADRENAAKAMQAKIDIAMGEFKHKEMLQKLNIDRDKTIKDLRGQYENRINGTNFNWSERVRLESARGDIEGMQSPGNTETFAESLRECDGAYTTLEKACQVTTIDYNLLRVWGDAVCNQVECVE
jgi:Tfp pilus assembly protein PilV